MSFLGGLTNQPRIWSLVEFKAGKMNLRGNMVYPDKRKGLLYLHQSDDMLMHLCWKERSSYSPEDDFVIFPDEVEFKKVTQNTTGRVYIVKWRSTDRKLFFWMQEPSEDEDEQYCKKINDLLNHPPTYGFDDDRNDENQLQSFMERMAGGGTRDIDPGELSNVLHEMSPMDLALLLSSFRGGDSRTGHTTGTLASQSEDSRSNVAAASTRPTTTSSISRTDGSSSRSRNSEINSSTATPPSSSTTSNKSKTGPIQMSTLTNVLTNLGNSTTTENSSRPVIDLYEIMNSENLIPLLSNKDVQEKLRPHLPEGSSILNTENELRQSIQSPQFRQVVTTFSIALQSGELESILDQFEFPDDVIRAANQGDLQAFAQALEKHYKKSSNNTMDTN